MLLLVMAVGMTTSFTAAGQMKILLKTEDSIVIDREVLLPGPSGPGFEALIASTTGNGNSATGYETLYSNSSGSYNTASGDDALYSNTTGSNNIGEGYQAGFYLTTGSNNIDIGNLGVAAESGTIRIGTEKTQTAAYIAGIQSSHITGAAVYVTASGQLGVLASAERYKTAVKTMTAQHTEKLAQLRPVTFHLKSEPAGAVQYGLIAEEVNKIYPELVIHDDKGVIQVVRYDELAPMLLNEWQKEHRKLAVLKAEIHDWKLQQANSEGMQQQLNAITATLRQLQSENRLASTR